MATIAVRAVTFGGGANTAAPTTTIPAATQAGDLVLLFWTTALNTSPVVNPTSHAFTQILEDIGTSNNLGTRVLWLRAVAGDAGDSVTGASTPGSTRQGMCVVVLYNSDADGLVTLDGQAITTGGSHTMPTLNTVHANAVAIGYTGERASTYPAVGALFTAPAGYTEQGENGIAGTGGKGWTVATLLTPVSAGTNIGGGVFTSSGGAGSNATAASVAVYVAPAAITPKTVAVTWNVKAPITPKTVAVTWNVKAPITPKSVASTWNVRAPITPKTVASTWPVRAAISTATASTWGVRGFVIAQVATEWDVEGVGTTVVTSLATSWSVHASISKTVATSYNVRASISKTAASTWNIHASIAKTAATTWAVRTRMTAKTVSTTWNTASVISSQNYPLYAAHRGGDPGPEETLYAYQQSYLLGTSIAAEGDMMLLSDGTTVVLNHDTTIDRMASASSPFTTGNVSSFTAAQWATLLWHVNSGVGTDRPAGFLSDLLTEYGPSSGKPRLMVLEVKNAGTAAACLAPLASFKGQVLVQAFGLSDAQAAVTAGFTAMHLTNTPNFTTLVASGIKHVGVDQASITGTMVTNAHANGIKVWAYTVNSTSSRDSLLALGVDAFFTNKPATIPTDSEVTKTVSTTWSARTSVAKSASTTWGTRTSIAKSSASTWNTRTLAATATLTTWAIVRTISKQMETDWDDHAATGTTLLTTWDTRLAVDVSTDTSWDIYTSVLIALATSWSLEILTVDTRVISIVDRSRVVYISDRSDS